jgi:hypothetical protein
LFFVLIPEQESPNCSLHSSSEALADIIAILALLEGAVRIIAEIWKLAQK